MMKISNNVNEIKTEYISANMELPLYRESL